MFSTVISQTSRPVGVPSPAANNPSLAACPLMILVRWVVYEAEEGGFWAEVPAIPGCATQGENMEELLRNLHDAIEGCLSVEIAEPRPDDKRRILEIAV